MIQKYLCFFVLLGACTSCALGASRYSTHMSTAPENPSDLATAIAVIKAQAEALEALKTEIARVQEAYAAELDTLRKENASLRELVRHLRDGKKRETNPISSSQMLLQFADDPELQAQLEAARVMAKQELEQITYTRPKKKEPRKASDEAFPAELPREELPDVPLTPEDQAKADAGQVVIRRVVRETLCRRPATFYVQVQHQQLLEEVASSPAAAGIIEQTRLALPAHLGEQGRYDASVGAFVVESKFALHLPYYRQQDIFASSGLVISRSSLDYLLTLVYEATEPLCQLLADQVCHSICVGLDDTHVTLIAPKEEPQTVDRDAVAKRLVEKMRQAKSKGSKSLEASMWAYSGSSDKPYDVFDFRVSRHRDGPADFLQKYGGHVMADCYSGNLSVILGPSSSMTRMA